MSAFEILCFRQKLEEDTDNKEYRRRFHENYEWLDGYWRPKWEKDRDNAIMKFCEAFGEYYWQNIPVLQGLASELGNLGPIGKSINPNYEPTLEVVKDTMLLKSNEGSAAERFKAMMNLVRQIRNNLFHGKKMEINEIEIYERNKELVRLGAEITTVILDRLEQAERDLGL